MSETYKGFDIEKDEFLTKAKFPAYVAKKDGINALGGFIFANIEEAKDFIDKNVK